MASAVSDIIHVLDNLAPPALAEEWDNIGLQVGDPSWPVRHIWIALDPTLEVVDAACRRNVDLLITHHPLIFKPLKSIIFHTPLGKIIDLATRNHLAIFAAHTNLDSAIGGVNDILADRIDPAVAYHDHTLLDRFSPDRETLRTSPRQSTSPGKGRGACALYDRYLCNLFHGTKDQPVSVPNPIENRTAGYMAGLLQHKKPANRDAGKGD